MSNGKTATQTQSRVSEAKGIVADLDGAEVTNTRYDGGVDVDVERYITVDGTSLPRLLGRFSESGWVVLNVDFEAQRITLLPPEEA